MRKKAGIVVLCFSLILAVFLVGHICGGKAYSKLVIDEAGYESIIASRKQVSFKNPNLRMNGTGCFYSESSRSFYYSLKNTQNSNLNPNVSVSIDSGQVRVAFFDAAITEDGIKNNEKIRLLIYDKESYCEYNLICTGLPLLNIQCSNEISDEEHKMTMVLYDNGKSAGQGLIQSEGTIRYRGATTLYYPKKGFKIALTQKTADDSLSANPISILGMRKDEDWVLYAAYNDQEKIRNVFSQNLWKESCSLDNEGGVDQAAEYRYIELFINGDYYGLYAIGSPVDEASYKYDSDTSVNALYKSIYWSDLYGIMMPENLVTGYEVKSSQVLYEDGRIDNSDWDLFLDYCYYLEKNKHDDQALLKGIDLDNAVDIFLFFNLIQGMDTTYGPKAKNYYMGLTRQGDGTIKALYSPWDMDISWGNYWTGNIDINFTVPYDISPDENYLFENGYLNQLIVNKNALVKETIARKYDELRRGAWSDESIEKMLSDYEEDIFASGAFLRDKERWPEGSYQTANDLSAFKAYVKNRFKEYDAYMERFLELYDESIFIRRSAQYTDFTSRKFLVVINEPKILKDSDYMDLLEYIGMDVSIITEDTKVIVYDGKTKVTDVSHEWGGETFLFESKAGRVSTVRNKLSESSESGEWIYLTKNDYSVYLDGVFCYDTLYGYEPSIRIYFVEDKESATMDFTKDYSLDVRVDTFNDMYLYLKALNMYDYEIVMSFSSEDIFEDQALKQALEALSDRITYDRTDSVNEISFVIKDSMSDKIVDCVLFTYKMEKEKVSGQTKFVTLSCVRE